MATRGTKREHEPGKVAPAHEPLREVVGGAVLVREARHVHQHLHPTTACERVPSARSALRRRCSWRKRGCGTSAADRGDQERAPRGSSLDAGGVGEARRRAAADAARTGREVSRDGCETVREQSSIVTAANKAGRGYASDEAATARTLAEKLMLKYAFEEEEIRQARRGPAAGRDAGDPAVQRPRLRQPVRVDPPGTLPRTRRQHPVPRRRKSDWSDGNAYATSWASRLTSTSSTFSTPSSGSRSPRTSSRRLTRPTTTAPWPDAPRRHRGSRSRRTGTPWPDGRSSAVPSTGTRKPASRRRKATGARRRSIARASPKASWTRWRTGCGGCATRRSGKLAPTTPRPLTGCRSLSAPARRWWRSSCTSGSPTSVLLRR